ncbi:MAG: hypothetical protein K5840_00270 [Eubacterium sp.]|nr:hypothetical protein [Eubacterium sp.]
MVYIIANRNARKGTKKGNAAELLTALDARNIEYDVRYTEYAGHAKELAREISSLPGEKRLIVMGGDGTVNEAINGIVDFDNTLFGYVPLGSGDDLARGLNIKMSALERLLLVSQTDEVTPMDLGELIIVDGSRAEGTIEAEYRSVDGCSDEDEDTASTGRLYAVSAGIGIDALVCKQVNSSALKKFLNKFGLGSLSYGLLTVKNLFTMRSANGRIVYSTGGRSDDSPGAGSNSPINMGITPMVVPIKKMIFTAVMNHPCEGGGVPMAPFADAFDGRLSVCCVGNVSRLHAFFCFPLLLIGKHKIIKSFRLFNASRIEIGIDEPMVVHTDGEYCGTARAVRFRAHPGILKMLG